MNFKTKALFTLLIISVFLLSSCEVYYTLYGQQTPTGNVVDTEEPSEEVPEETETPEDTELPEETETPEEEPIVIPIEPSGDATVVAVDEGDLVNLEPRAEDPDSDSQLSFTFTSPLDETGKWQTTYGDNGEYTVTVTVSDGDLTTNQDVLVIVRKKEEAPMIDVSRPIENTLTIDETDEVQFSVDASDLNNDDLQYEWKVDGLFVGSDNTYLFESTYDDSGSHTVKVDVTDGTSVASKLWSVDVANVNRLPVLDQIGDIQARETDSIVITAFASDEDYDTLTYSISDDRFEQDENVFTWETDYESSGSYEVTVTASDGQDAESQTFMIVVDNVNRPPRIIDIIQK